MREKGNRYTRAEVDRTCFYSVRKVAARSSVAFSTYLK